MNKNKALRILNPVLAVLFVIQAWSGMFHSAIPYEIFKLIHGIGGPALTAAAVMHLILNWAWVKTTFFRKKQKPAVSG